MNRSAKCAMLEKDATLRGFFALLCADSDSDAALWIEEGQDRHMTYGELFAYSIACAETIDRMGLGRAGDWIGIAVDTCPDWPVMFWGLVAAGRRPLLLDPSQDDSILRYLLAQAGATGIISRKTRPWEESIRQVKPDELLVRREASPDYSPIWSDQIAVCTSGTTATARVFVYDGAAICTQAIGIIRQQEDNKLTKESLGPLPTLCFLPLNHIFGFMTNMIWTSFLGYPQVFLHDRAPQTILSTCRHFKVAFVLAVPLLVNNLSVTLQKRVAKEPPLKRFAFNTMKEISLLAQRISPVAGLKIGKKLFHSINENLFGDTIQQIVVGGSHTPREHLRTINALGYAVTCGFGMTETAVTSAESMIDLGARLSGSVGWPFHITQYKVRPDGDDEDRGELLIRCRAMHTGRLVDGEILPPALNDEGWFETGDVVRMGKRGRMWVEGRTKDVILGESGENVYPDEIEDVFGGLDGAEQLCVLGTAEHPGSPYDAVTLVLGVGALYNDDVFLKELAQRVAQRNLRLIPVRRVRRLLVTPESMPVANSIKVKRLALREQIEQRKIAYRALNLPGSVAPPPKLPAGEADDTKLPAKVAPVQAATPPEALQIHEIREKVRRCFAEVLEIPESEIADDAHFIDDLGGDSLQSLGAALKVEELFGILIPVEEYARCTSVGDLSALILARMEGHGPYESEAAPNDEEVTPITRFEDAPEYIAFQKRLTGLSGQKNPYFVPHDSPLTDVSIMDGREVLNFGSYNYVGMSGRKEVNDAAIAAVEHYGTSASGSRLLGGEKPIHQELERELARWKHAESALVCVGGHSTNVTFVGNFCGKNDLIVYDALAHNSVQEGCRLSGATSKPFPHNDAAALESILRAQRHKFAKTLIVVEGVYSMDGDIAPIPDFVALKKKYGCFLMVDEAHSACVIGKTGGGVDEYFGLAHDDIDVKMGTLSKGLGTCGGYLAGRSAIIDYLRYSMPGFVFSVGISPPLAAATLASIRALQTHPEIMESLRANIKVFLEEAHRRNLNTCLADETSIIPILVGRDEDAFLLSTALGEKGVFVPPAVYPAVPKNKSRLRFCVISEHKPEQIIRALDTLVETASELRIPLPPMGAK